MQTEVRFLCDTPAEAAAIIAAVGGIPATITGAVNEPEKPKRGPKPKPADNTAAPAAAAPAAAGTAVVAVAAQTSQADPLAGLMGGGQAPAGDLAGMLGIPAAQLPPAAPAAKPLTQADVVAELTKLGQNPAKGPNAIRAVLTAMGGFDTVAKIPPERFAEAIALARQQ